MTIRAQEIIDKAEAILHDAGNRRWGPLNLLDWLNQAQIEIVKAKPNSYSITTAFTLVAGTRQSIPTGGIAFIEAIRNMGTNGTTPGDAIHMIEREELDTYHASWNTDSASATVIHAMFDPRDPKYFYVYPQQPTSSFGYIEATYSKVPSTVKLTDSIILADEYESAIMDLILFRAFSIDAASSAQAASRAQNHYQIAMASLGIQSKLELAVKPNQGEGR